MWWFNHPKQVGSGRPVAMLMQRQGEKRTSVTIDTPLVDLPALHEADDSDLPALAFSVRYRLAEYVSFMWQHAGYLIRRRRIGWAATYYMLVKSTAGAALHFVAQGRARRTYDFTIDRHGIVRSTAGGVTLIGWEDVTAIRSYSRGYLMVLKRGTLPIPFRCLDREQSAALRGFAARVRAASR
jgi:hypothetical protein